MKRVLAFLSALLIAASALAGPFAITASGQTFVGSVAYATLVANTPCTAARDGQIAYATDWGTNGTQVYCKGSITRWLPANGQVVLKRMGAAVSGIANTETILLTVTVPAGVLQSGDMIHLRFSSTKSGVTDNAQANFRVGTTGTTADTAITGLNSVQVIPAAATTVGEWVGFRVLSNTSIQRMGLNSANQSSYGAAANATAIAAATTGLSDFSTNPTALTFTIKSSSTTDTIGVQEVTLIQEAG